MKMRFTITAVTLALLVSCAAPSRTADPDGLCAGLVVDKKVRAVKAMDRPPLLVPVTDPAFGSRIIRITDAGEGVVIKPMYSTIQAWNADESLLILWHRERGHQLYDGRSYVHLMDLDLESPTDIEQLYWDPIDPDVFYYPANYNTVPLLWRYRVSRKKNEVVRDFRDEPTNCPVNDWGATLSTGGDPMDMSWGPEKVIGLLCGDKKFLYSIATDEVLALKVWPGDTAPTVSFDGKLAFREGRVFDRELAEVRKLELVNIWEHASLGRGESGPVYAAVDFDGSPAGTLVAHDLETGKKRPIIAESNGWPYPPTSTHVSGVARNAPPGWFALSIVGDPWKRCLLCQELVIANVDSGEVCRVAHHRSFGREGKMGYWAEPHAVISPSGTRILFGSDWGNGGLVDTYVVELPAYLSER